MGQLELPFESDQTPHGNRLSLERLGTFKDSLRAPVHRWFRYPAGYSYKLIDALIEDHELGNDSWVLDCFVGSGTTSIAAQFQGVNSIGIEAHPFVYWVAKTKLFWMHDLQQLRHDMQGLLSRISDAPPFPGDGALQEFPELLSKCYSDVNLWRLKYIRDLITNGDYSQEVRDFFLLALTDTLRTASSAGTGWPYIAPSKFHGKNEQPAIKVFSETVNKMYRDLVYVRERAASAHPGTLLLNMDARLPYPVEPESVDLAVTSPPYLNNFDYADRTRLEMYFFGWAQTWGDITSQVRDKLIIAATTQIKRAEFEAAPLGEALRDADQRLFAELTEKVKELGRLRLTKGGRKSYDFMVAGYFNDMLQVIQQVYRTLKPGGEFVLVLGDSAPYGVYIPTEEYLARLALSVGFRNYEVQVLRERGGKWGHNPQRHKVMLKESILFLKK